MKSMFSLVLGLLAVGLCSQAWAQKPTPLPKKIIEWGWDTPDPIYVRDHVREMEQRPFDGIVMQGLKAKRGGQEVPFDSACFGKERFELEEFSDTIQALKETKFERFTDNFIRFNVIPGDVDWFDDCSSIMHNAWVAAKIAQEGGVKGWMFDMEHYGAPLWNYPKLKYAQQKTFEQYARQVRLRGREFMLAVNDAYPNITMFLAFGYSLCLPVAQRPEGPEEHPYGLMSAFLDGMLEAATPTTKFIDGNESAYYYTTTDDYYRAFHLMKQRVLALVKPEDWAKYLAQTQAGTALYVDLDLGLGTWGEASRLAYYLTPEERLRWFEHNVYYALTTADEYAWCYNEKMDWYKNDVPAGLEEAIASARQKVAQGEALGFDIRDMIAGAKEKMAAATSGNK